MTHGHMLGSQGTCGHALPPALDSKGHLHSQSTDWPSYAWMDYYFASGVHVTQYSARKDSNIATLPTIV